MAHLEACVPHGAAMRYDRAGGGRCHQGPGPSPHSTRPSLQPPDLPARPACLCSCCLCSQALSSGCRGRPASSLGMIFPWKGHCDEKESSSDGREAGASISLAKPTTLHTGHLAVSAGRAQEDSRDVGTHASTPGPGCRLPTPGTRQWLSDACQPQTSPPWGGPRPASH